MSSRDEGRMTIQHRSSVLMLCIVRKTGKPSVLGHVCSPAVADSYNLDRIRCQAMSSMANIYTRYFLICRSSPDSPPAVVGNAAQTRRRRRKRPTANSLICWLLSAVSNPASAKAVSLRCTGQSSGWLSPPPHCIPPSGWGESRPSPEC